MFCDSHMWMYISRDTNLWRRSVAESELFDEAGGLLQILFLPSFANCQSVLPLILAGLFWPGREGSIIKTFLWVWVY